MSTPTAYAIAVLDDSTNVFAHWADKIAGDDPAGAACLRDYAERLTRAAEGLRTGKHHTQRKVEANMGVGI